MAQKKTVKKAAAKKAVKSSSVWSAEEKAAMRELARERKAQATREEAEAAVVEAIAKMQEPDRSMAKRIHALIKANAPGLAAKTWYGMPAYANAEGNVVCFFQDAGKFKARYATLGFNDRAHLDSGDMWPTSYALKQLTPDAEQQIIALVKKAVG